MSEYTKYDFSECLKRITLEAQIDTVLRAWGISNREYADWCGGFVSHLRNGKFAYISGWSDSSGWG